MGIQDPLILSINKEASEFSGAYSGIKTIRIDESVSSNCDSGRLSKERVSIVKVFIAMK